MHGYYLGGPGWAVKSWVGRLFPPGTKPADFLARYAEVFNAVEGNTTFYALPTPEMVARWNEQTPATFRFCFKFPRTITHDKLLVDTGEVATFLDRIAPLSDKLGPLFVQLPPRFSPDALGRLGAFLDALPRAYRYAVELRHELFFAAGEEEAEAAALLSDRGVDLVIMDARGLHASPNVDHADVRQRKPKLPVVMRATGKHPFVRCVPHDDFAANVQFVKPWVAQVARWIADGLQPYFFMHAPDDTFAPENAYAFHAMLREVAPVGDLPPWPGTPRQLGLFS